MVLAALLCLALAGGCAMLGPDFQTPEAPVPASWSLQDDDLFQRPSEEQSRLWWEAFDDSRLTSLVERAYEQNLGLRVAALRIVEARAALALARGQVWPQVQEATGSLSAVRAPEGLPDRGYVTASAGFDAAWELDFWGRYRRGVEAQDASLAAAWADYDDLLVSLSAEVARTYVNIRTIQERIRLARSNVRIQERGLELVREQFDAGTVTELDLLQARTLLSTTRAAIPALQTALAAAKNALAVLLGVPPDQVDPLLGQERGRIPRVRPEIAVDLPAGLLRRRPDVRRAEMLAAAQCARIGIARAALFPSFTLFGSIGWSASDRNGGSLGDLFDSGSFSAVFGPSFTWSLFNYGRLKNNERIQDARLQQLITAYQDTVLNAAREVEDGMSGYVNARRQAAHIRNAVRTSRRSLDLAMLQYEEGLVDYQRVLDSTRSLTQQQDQYAELQGNIALAAISLYKALGGGWELRRRGRLLPVEVRESMEERTGWGNLLQGMDSPAGGLRLHPVRVLDQAGDARETPPPPAPQAPMRE